MKRTLVIVPCGLSKIWDRKPQAGPTIASLAYTGPPFRLNKQYAERFGDTWVILSAKYGFIPPSFVLPGPYDVTFKRKSTGPVSVDTLKEQILLMKLDGFEVVIGLGGKEYRSMIEQAFNSTNSILRFPFAGLNILQIMHKTKSALKA